MATRLNCGNGDGMYEDKNGHYISYEEHEKEILKLRLNFYRKLEKKIKKILNAELDIEDYDTEIYNKIQKLENEIHSS